MKPSLILAATIRVVSFLFGCFLILASITVASLGGPQETVPVLSPLLTLPLAACLLASGFFSVAIWGERMARSVRHRAITALLLMLPLAFGASQLLSPIHPEMRGQGLFFFLPALGALICTVWPWTWGAVRTASKNS